jgi:hypothetical protein
MQPFQAQAECHFYLGGHQATGGETESAKTNFQTAVHVLEPAAKRPEAAPGIREICAKSLAALNATESKPLNQAINVDPKLTPLQSPVSARVWI